MHEADRHDAVVACERLCESMQKVIDVFTAERSFADALLQVLQGDQSLTKTLRGFDFAGERTTLSDVLDEFETARREARLTAWSLMASEGTSIGEMARIFGISRQLISRQLRDFHGATSPATD
jgi:hypothetical protein